MLTPSGGFLVVLEEGLQYHANDDIFFVCIQSRPGGPFIHQGSNQSVKIIVKMDHVPEWFKIIAIIVCLLLSGTFSGLNLGLMSLDQTELKIVINSGSEKERGYANAIHPVRKHGNFLLCSILLGNVLVNNSLTIMLDSMIGQGIWAVVGATIAIVIFGEIIPQAICSRHGLAVGAHTILLTKFFMGLTAPLAWPLSKLLDCVLGREVGTVYNRARLMELIKVTDGMNDLQRDEVNMVTGALVLNQKKVEDVMTRIHDCYMLSLDRVLDFETISEIKSQGYSRIPVYKKEKNDVVYILFAKDLMCLDMDNEMTVEELCKFYRNEPNFVYHDTNLTDVFNEFKAGDKGHMAIVQTINTEGDGDPFHETVGLVTLEDIVEEIIQSEIVDETDVFVDNKSKKKRKSCYRRDIDLSMIAHRHPQHHVTVSPQVSLAVLQFLTTSVRPFSPENFSQQVLQKLLSMDVYREVKLRTLRPGEVREEKEGVLMNVGVQCDFFVLIIEGRVEVTIGKEQKVFLEGPFSCFGEQMLTQELTRSQTLNSLSASDRSLASVASRQGAWFPDYKLRAMTDVVYLKIRKSIYQLAIKANKANNLNGDSDSNLKEQDLVEVMTKVTKHDADFESRESAKSPEKLRGEMSLLSLRTKMSPRDEVQSLRVDNSMESRRELCEESLDEGDKLGTPSNVVFMISDSEDVSGSREFEIRSPERSSLLSSEHRMS